MGVAMQDATLPEVFMLRSRKIDVEWVGVGVGQKEEWEKGGGEEDERRMGVVWSVCTGGNS